MKIIWYDFRKIRWKSRAKFSKLFGDKDISTTFHSITKIDSRKDIQKYLSKKYLFKS